MSAADRKMKMADLRSENDQLRDGRNAMIHTNAELLQRISELEEQLRLANEDAERLERLVWSEHAKNCGDWKVYGQCNCGWIGKDALRLHSERIAKKG